MPPSDIELLSRAAETTRTWADSPQSCAYTALQVAKSQRPVARPLGY